MEDFKMKKSFLKFLPLMAAVMLTTACSKDDENQDIVTPDNNEQIAKGELIPFSIQVVTDNQLSKAGAFSEDNKKNIKIAFADADVNVLKMTLQSSVNSSEVAYLTLKNINGTFEGDIPASWVGQTIKATVGLLNGSAISSDKGLLELMASCNHPLAGEFKAGVNSSVTLTDQNAYFEIIMSPLQHKLDVTINGSAKTVDLSNEGKVWIAVNTSSFSFGNFSTFFYTKAKADINPGQIYTINRGGFVYLGDDFDALWADKNYGANSFVDAGTYYNYGEANALNGVTLPRGGEAGFTDFKALDSYADWIWTDNYNNSNVTGFIVIKKGCTDISTSPHIFLPAVGYYDQTNSFVNDPKCGYFWSETEKDNDRGYNARFTAMGTTGIFYHDSYTYKQCKYSVRPVIRF